MSGTSLDGVDIVHVSFNKDANLANIVSSPLPTSKIESILFTVLFMKEATYLLLSK